MPSPTSATTSIPARRSGIVGESGSGKSVSTMSLLGLIPCPPGRVASGTAIFGGADLLTMKTKDLRKIRGGPILLIFQDLPTALNPVLTVGQQLSEAPGDARHRSDGKARA